MKSIFRSLGLRRAPGTDATPSAGLTCRYRTTGVVQTRAVQLLAMFIAVSACSTLAWASSLVLPATDVDTALGAGRLDISHLDEPVEVVASPARRRQAIEAYAARYRISADLATAILDHSAAEGIDPDIAFRLVQTESSFRRTTVSTAGAIGYAQIKPSTARWLDPTVDTEDLFERDTNLRLGFGYLAMLADKYDQDMRMALLAYNRGPARVRRMIAAGEDPANGYASRILQSRN